MTGQMLKTDSNLQTRKLIQSNFFFFAIVYTVQDNIIIKNIERYEKVSIIWDSDNVNTQ